MPTDNKYNFSQLSKSNAINYKKCVIEIQPYLSKDKTLGLHEKSVKYIKLYKGNYKICTLSNINICKYKKGLNVDYTIYKYLNSILSKCNLLILLGNIFHFMSNKVTKRKMMVNMPYIFKWFEKNIISKTNIDGKVLYISGDKDDISRSLFDCPLSCLIKLNDKRLFFTHGHVVNNINLSSNVEDFTLTDTNINDTCDFLNNKKCKSASLNNNSIFNDFNIDNNPSIYKLFATEIAIKYNYDIVIFGHCKTPELSFVKNNKLYINTGVNTLNNNPNILSITINVDCNTIVNLDNKRILLDNLNNLCITKTNCCIIL